MNIHLDEEALAAVVGTTVTEAVRQGVADWKTMEAIKAGAAEAVKSAGIVELATTRLAATLEAQADAIAEEIAAAAAPAVAAAMSEAFVGAAVGILYAVRHPGYLPEAEAKAARAEIHAVLTARLAERRTP